MTSKVAKVTMSFMDLNLKEEMSPQTILIMQITKLTVEKEMI